MEASRNIAPRLAVSCLVAVAGSVSAQRPAEPDVPPLAERVAEAVAGCADGRVGEVELFRSLVQLQPPPVEAYFELLDGGVIPHTWIRSEDWRDRHPDVTTLRSNQRSAVLSALLEAPLDDLRDLLDRHVDASASAATRRLALQVLAQLGTGPDLARAVRFASLEAEDGTVPRDLRQDLTDAFARILSRDEYAHRSVRACFDAAPAGLASSIVRALGHADPESAIVVSSELLGSVHAVDPLILGTIADLAEDVEPPFDEAIPAAVRPHLFSADPRVAQVATKAVARLEDYEAIPSLIRLLDERNGNVRSSAARALVDLTRVRLGEDAAAWTAWYEREMAWWDQSADRTMLVAARGRPAEALQAVLELSRKRLFRHEVAAALAPVTARPEEQLAMTACAVLGALGSSVGRPALVRALDHDAAPVREAAAASLRKMTGLDLGADFEAWSTALEGR